MIRFLAAGLALLAFVSGASGDDFRPTVTQRDDLRRLFSDAGTDGTMIVYDPRANTAIVINSARASRKFSPASTFKIANSLIGLETGAVKTVDGEVFAWNAVRAGGKAPAPGCEADLTLRVAFRLSCVPVYQEIARRVGRAAYDHWLVALDYGNQDAGGSPVDQFWLTGNLRITTWRQIAFLKRLVAGDLPVSARALDQVRDIMVVEKTLDFALRAKTGLGAEKPYVGWWVGWVDKGGEVRIFALNMDVRDPNKFRRG